MLKRKERKKKKENLNPKFTIKFGFEGSSCTEVEGKSR